jgi:hypothetical protein
MKADCVPPSSSHARTTCAATSGVHLGCLAAANHIGSAVVVAVFVVIAPRTLRRKPPVQPRVSATEERGKVAA